MHLAWATDIHLNFLSRRGRQRFLESINGQADALVVTGDIAESNKPGRDPPADEQRAPHAHLLRPGQP